MPNRPRFTPPPVSPSSWEVLNGVGVDGVEVNFPFSLFFVFLRFPVVFAFCLFFSLSFDFLVFYRFFFGGGGLFFMFFVFFRFFGALLVSLFFLVLFFFLFCLLFCFLFFHRFSSSQENLVLSAHLQADAVDGPCLRPRGKLQKTVKKGNFAPTPSTPTPLETFRPSDP